MDFQPAGSPGGVNFGWDIREGLHDYEGGSRAGLTDPVTEYSHGEGGCSITAGRVVRDASLPAWQGVFLFGDFCTGYVWGLLRDDTGQWQTTLLYQTGLQITSFGTGAAGRDLPPRSRRRSLPPEPVVVTAPQRLLRRKCRPPSNPHPCPSPGELEYDYEGASRV